MAAKLPWYTWYLHDWLGDEDRASMTLAERGLYRDCLDLNYANGSIPAEPAILCRLLGLDREEFDSAWEKVQEFFDPTEFDSTRLSNRRADKVMGETKAYKKAQSAHAKKGWAKRRKQVTSVEMGTHRLPNADPLQDTVGGAMGTQCHSQSQSQSQSQPEKNKISGSKDPSPPKASPSRDLAAFTDWYKTYPRKASRADAEAAYAKVVVKGHVTEDRKLSLKASGLTAAEERHARLMATTPLWVEREFAGREPSTIPHPATFLRRLDWLEAPPEAREAPRKRTIFDEVAERRAAREVANAH